MNTTDLTPLPAHSSLEQYKKQAKELLRSGDVQRITRNRPHPPDKPKLADAQLTIAREHRFESWPKFAKMIGALARADPPVSKFELAADAIVNGDADSSKALEQQSGVNSRPIRAYSSSRSDSLHQRQRI